MIDDGEFFEDVCGLAFDQKRGNHDWFGFHLFNSEISTLFSSLG